MKTVCTRSRPQAALPHLCAAGKGRLALLGLSRAHICSGESLTSGSHIFSHHRSSTRGQTGREGSRIKQEEEEEGLSKHSGAMERATRGEFVHQPLKILHNTVVQSYIFQQFAITFNSAWINKG